MATPKFRIKQAAMGGERWLGIEFRACMAEEASLDPVAYTLSDPIISRVCGDEVDYGALFAYCFRRFGYPERGWDGDKQLVGYYLTTPHPGMVLRVTPSLGNQSTLSLGFLVEWDAHWAIENYARGDRLDWEVRALDWAEQQGLPDWMPEWVTLYTEFSEASHDVPLASNWRQTLNFPYATALPGSRAHELNRLAAEYRKALFDGYSQVEPQPAYYLRPVDVESWNNDDPLKPFAQAALVALADLHTPVGVRDQAINAFGLVEDGRAKAKPAKSAGYPSGALGNGAPSEFAVLHGHIMRRGNGNAKRGIKNLLKTVFW